MTLGAAASMRPFAASKYDMTSMPCKRGKSSPASRLHAD